MQCPTQHHIVTDHFVKQDVLLERTRDHEKPPVLQARVSETTSRSKLRVLFKKAGGGFDCGGVVFCHFPSGVDGLPLELPLHVRDKIVGLENAHAAADFRRDRTRSRMPSKSLAVNGVTGLSAASSSQASNSGVTAKGLCCCSRTERRRSLTSSLGLEETPARTWS